MWVSLNQFRDPIFGSWCPALGPPRSRLGSRRKSLRGETGSPSPSSQREDGEPEESVREASRSDSVGKQVASAPVSRASPRPPQPVGGHGCGEEAGERGR
ncbi:unnamed protein product [Gulo gulo]|uniref:Uncharacterized protein n=1 Tax=Gulo gulo TaxID=48420 RepID=A0A9X9LGR6_GULGU|nr:unnamed protein product [Gulo gulo]